MQRTSALVKYSALAVLVLQNALLVLVMRASQLNGSASSSSLDSPKYLASTAVLMGEVIKLFASACFLLAENGYNLANTLRVFKVHFNARALQSDLPSLSIPALLYLVQNNFVYIAAYNLEPAPFQLLFQLKIFSTAMLSVLILKRVLTMFHWRALAVLFLGVALVQLSTLSNDKSSSSSPQERGALKSANHDEDPIKGLFAILVAVMCSGLSGVWFEKILKGSPSSIWVRNIQLALISLALASASIWIQPKDYAQVRQFGLLQGYSSLVWLVIVIQSFGGLLVAIVVKYADNILKGFATSIATVLSTLCSVIWLDFKLSPLFLAGAVLVLGSALMYNAADSKSIAVTVAAATASGGGGAISGLSKV